MNSRSRFVASIRGIYDRYEYFDEKADAFAKLAALVEKIINPPPPNVIPMEGARRSRRKKSAVA